MASPQWKTFQPPNQDSAILAYHRSPSFSKTSGAHMSNSSSSGASNGPREAGIVEKLLHTYGFIQCCERQARLFFHYSQFSGNIEHLKLGDAVEFEMTYDRRTGKPIASAVVKISSEAISSEVLSDDRVSGFVTTEIKNGTEGRVAYENRGECFFLPYTKADLEVPDAQLHPGDKVTFLIATDKNTGNLRATRVSLEKPQPERYQGVVCALKETFGFIERADVVKEIFFHSSECKDFKGLALGDNVEFAIQTRNNKEVAVQITRLPHGTVVFADVSPELVVGQITKALERVPSRQPTDPLPGRIRYKRDNREIEIPFGEEDPCGEYTLHSGDWVQFQVATDRRDQLQRATNIELLEKSFLLSGEKREQGIVTAVKDTYGFIKCANRDSRLYFCFSELLNPDCTVEPQDEVEFTVAQDPSSPNRVQGIRIKLLPRGSFSSDSYGGHTDNGSLSMMNDHLNDDSKLIGVVEKEPASQWSSKSPQKNSSNNNNNNNKVASSQGKSVKNGDTNGVHELNSTDSLSDGIIGYFVNGAKETIHYQLKDCDPRNMPRVGDKVEFILAKGNCHYATDVKIVNRNMRNGFKYTHRGFIAALKDSFGFIETEEHDREVFFHFSVVDGSHSALELGQEVEYGLSRKGSKWSAECVRKLPAGTIPGEEVKPEIMNGTVVRPVRCFNPDQSEYSGLVAVTLEGDNEGCLEYPFGITGLEDKHDLLQKGDVVQFQIGVSKTTGQERAVNIKAIRTRLQATVDAIKGHFGFLSHEVEDGKKLFFHMSEVKGGVTLQPGDRVEFVVLHNQRTGKYSACNVEKIGETQPSQRPERLKSRLRTMSLEDNGPRVVILRQPKGPDGTNGFNIPRKPSVDVRDALFPEKFIVANSNSIVNSGGDSASSTSTIFATNNGTIDNASAPSSRSSSFSFADSINPPALQVP